MLKIRIMAALPVVILFAAWFIATCPNALAARVTVQLSGDTQNVESVGAFLRWDIDGNHIKPVNPKAKIDQPEVKATAKNEGGGRWVFSDLPKGDYDLVVMMKDKTRIEGWHYPPVLEFDPVFDATATTDEETRKWIDNDIRNARHYENKVVPLFMGGDDRAVRVLVMLIRDLPTSLNATDATMRFEVWQYDFKYGGWVKNRRTKVMHRIIMPRDQLRQWTWVWDARLGRVKVGSQPVSVEYKIPSASDENVKGLRPY